MSGIFRICHVYIIKFYINVTKLKFNILHYYEY